MYSVDHVGLLTYKLVNNENRTFLFEVLLLKECLGDNLLEDVLTWTILLVLLLLEVVSLWMLGSTNVSVRLAVRIRYGLGLSE